MTTVATILLANEPSTSIQNTTIAGLMSDVAATLLQEDGPSVVPYVHLLHTRPNATSDSSETIRH